MTARAQRIRVLVVDDSAFARKVIRLALGADDRLEVVGTATDGLDALEKIQTLKPDVVTLDLVMPDLDGVGVLRTLQTLQAPPRVVLVTISGEASELTIEALQLGAVGLVTKPTALATERLYELAGELVEKVVNAASARLRWPTMPPLERLAPAVRASKLELVVVGTSTGGPQALTRLLSRLPADFPLPIAIALHIPAEYTEALASRLNSLCELEVVEAHDGQAFETGQVIIAKGGKHLTVHRSAGRLVAQVSAEPVSMLYFPSVDLLFTSAAEACGSKLLGVVLTGMGDDGLLGARSIVNAGGRVLTESESSAVVFGMPRSVKDAGLSAGEAPINEMADEILRFI